MESQFDSENYWHRSTSKAFSFDDDEIEGSSLGHSGGNAKWYLDAVPGDSVGILSDDTISEASFDSSALGGALNLSIKSIVDADTLQLILKEQTLDDRESFISKNVSSEEELRLLRRRIQTMLYHPSPEVTAYKLLLCKNPPLEVFKSLHEKEQLLDEVLQYGGGDGLIGVLLFFKRTLSRQLFHQTLQSRPQALQHYLNYLQQRHQAHEAYELLQLCGKLGQAALMQFTAALACNDLATRKLKLSQLVQRYNAEATTVVVPLYQQLFGAALKLLELVEQQRHMLDNVVNLNSTPIEVLHACCSKHSNWKEQDLTRATSPFRLCAEQQISPAQFEWTALNERAAAQAYVDLENVFERVPNWHPLKQKLFNINFSLETAVRRLHELQAPVTVLYLFLSKMSNNSEKLELAQRVKCTKAVIDALAGLKDAGQLTQLRETLPERSEEQFYCDKAMKALQNKRWSTDNLKLKL